MPLRSAGLVLFSSLLIVLFATSAHGDPAADAPALADIDAYRDELARLFGIHDLLAVPVGERPPLNPVIVGKLDRDGYDIYRVRFESLPGFFVAASLYVPDDPAFPLPRPAVICPHGHWDPPGRLSNWVQVRAVGLARLGYTVLTYDASGVAEQSRDGINEGQEALSAAQSWPGGPIPMGLRAYEVSRAVDYLETRWDVADPTQLAITGSSGGASQSLYGAMFDRRIEVVVAAAWSSIAGTHRFAAADESIPYFGRRLDPANLAAMVYPAKLLLLSENQGRFWMARKALDLYAAQGHPDWARFVAVDSPHGYGAAYRERMYAWLSRWVLGADAGDTIPDPPGVSDSMRLETSGDMNDDLPRDRLSYVELGAAFREKLPGYGLPSTPSEWAERLASIETAVQALMDRPAGASPIRVEPGDPAENPESVRILPEDRAVAMRAGGKLADWQSWVGLAVFKPAGRAPWPTVLLVNPTEFPEGDATYKACYSPIDDSDLIGSLVAKGYAVVRMTLRFNDNPVAFDPQAFGYTNENAATRALNWAGAPLFGRHLYDVSSVLNYLAARGDVDAKRVTVWGLGEGGPVAIGASALDRRVCQCVAQRTRASFCVRRNDRHPPWSYPPRILEAADLPHLASLIAPRRLIVAAAVDDERRALAPPEAEVAFAWTTAAYEALDAPAALHLLTGASAVDPSGDLDAVCSPPAAVEGEGLRCGCGTTAGDADALSLWLIAAGGTLALRCRRRRA